MECEQLIRLIKDWYLKVTQETMAPARMMQFVDHHVKGCPVCKTDLVLPEEIEKIREFVLPDSKIPKAVRSVDDRPTPEISPDESDEYDEDFEDTDRDALDDEEGDEGDIEPDLDEDLNENDII
jgi:hypothetical protein